MIHHYLCIQIIDSNKKELIITYTAEYLHEYITQPNMTAEYIMTHAIKLFSEALKYVPNIICNYQLVAIEAVQEIFANR